MKRILEATAIFGYNAFTNGRYVHYRNIETGMNLEKFYPGNNKRKTVDAMRKDGIIVYHSLYRDFNKRMEEI